VPGFKGDTVTSPADLLDYAPISQFAFGPAPNEQGYYSHHHADYGSAASLFDGDVTRIGHEETKRLLLHDDDPNHTPANIYIHFPDHGTLMFIDVVNAGWVPIYNLNLSEDVIGYMDAPEIALAYPWTHLISGHLGRLATRDDVAVHRQQIADIDASAREALASVDPARPTTGRAERTSGPASRATSTPSPSARPCRSSPSTPVCSPPPTSRPSPPRRRSRSCSRTGWTAATADRFTPDQNA
jgi:hypothetical protein